MTDPVPSLAAPAWVYKRDGRLVPFEADRISRALFAATEDLGRPDAFLARELTDGVVHFLAADLEGTTPTTLHVADLVVKVVRELGQPVLAQAYLDGQKTRTKTAGKSARATGSSSPPKLTEQIYQWAASGDQAAPLSWRAGATCLREFTLREVFKRDLVAAHQDGLLTLTGLEAPFELAGYVLGPAATDSGGLIERLEAARAITGDLVALDGPEFVLAQATYRGDAGVAAFVRELGIGLRATGLRAVVNLNSATPPSWADDLAEGPLFAEQQHPSTPARLAGVADALREEIQRSTVLQGRGRIDWHLGERDFAETGSGRLLTPARWAIEGGAVAFVFDRPRRALALAEGLNRRHPAVLLTVGLHLPRLLRQIGQQPAEPAVFLQKLGSLARLALSAAVQKRDFLRRQVRALAGLRRGFLLDRARLVVAPVGLDAAVRALIGPGLGAGGAALDLGRQIVQRLRDVLRDEGRACLLDTCLDAPADFALGEEPIGDKAGLTCWDATATVKHQLRAAGCLHAVAEMGTAAVLLAEGHSITAEQLVDCLRWVWEQTDVVRFCLAREDRPLEQRTLPETLFV